MTGLPTLQAPRGSHDGRMASRKHAGDKDKAAELLVRAPAPASVPGRRAVTAAHLSLETVTRSAAESTSWTAQMRFVSHQ